MFRKTDTAPGSAQKCLNDFVAVAFRKQTYLNILYLLFTFPLGTAYFVFLVTGLSLGFHLLGIWLGIPILFLVFMSWWEMASFERQLAEWLLGVKMPPMSYTQVKADSILEAWISKLKNPVTWKALLFLLMKFPLGVFSLGMAVFMISLTVFLFLSPFMYYFGYAYSPDASRYAFGISLMAFLSSIPIGILSLHVMSFLARISGKFAVLMLGVSQKNDGSALREN